MSIKYHKYALDKIRSAQPIILLNGPSIHNIENHIHKFKDKDVIFCSINNRFSIENKILHKINKKVDVWQVNCTLESRRLSKEIVNFLSDNDSLLFLTTSEALSKIIDVIEIHKDQIDFSKIFLLDNIHYNLCSIIDEMYTPAQWGKINSLGFLLCFFALLNPKYNIYLFGCDGSDSMERKDKIYYDDENVKLRRKDGYMTGGIYSDTVFYNSRWNEIVQKYFIDRNLQIPTIINVNPESFYTCFEKVDYSSAFRELENIVKIDDKKKFVIDHNDNDYLYDYMRIILNIKNHNLHRSIEIERRIALESMENIEFNFNKEPIVGKSLEQELKLIKSIKDKINDKAKLGYLNRLKSKVLRLFLRMIVNYLK